MDRNLLALLAIAETRNITAAAERLNVTQPTLTKRLQQLESIFDCKLVERLPRGVKLTRFGERLLPHAQRIGHEYLHAFEEIRLVKSHHLDELRVGAGPLFHMRYLGPALSQLREEFPDTALQLMAGNNPQNLPKLRDGHLDVVFGITEALDDTDSIAFERLTTVEHGLILSSRHSMARRNTIKVHEVGNAPWVVYNDSLESEHLMPAYFSSQGLPIPKIALLTNSFALGLQMVAEGDYVMSMPVQLEAILDSNRVRLIRTSPPISRLPAGAYIRRSSFDVPVIRRLIEIVAEAADK